MFELTVDTLQRKLSDLEDWKNDIVRSITRVEVDLGMRHMDLKTCGKQIEDIKRAIEHLEGASNG